MGTGAGPTPHQEGPGRLGWWCGRKKAWPQQEEAKDASGVGGHGVADGLRDSDGPKGRSGASVSCHPETGSSHPLGLCLFWSVPQLPLPFLASYIYHLPLSFHFNPSTSVSLIFPHLLVSLQPLLFSFALVDCPLGLSVPFRPPHFSALLSECPPTPVSSSDQLSSLQISISHLLLCVPSSPSRLSFL